MPVCQDHRRRNEPAKSYIVLMDCCGTATQTSGSLHEQEIGKKIHTYLHSSQGCQQLDARIAYNEIDLVLFFCASDSGGMSSG